VKQDYLIYLQLRPLDADYMSLAAEFSAHQIYLVPVTLATFLRVAHTHIGVMAYLKTMADYQRWCQQQDLILRVINGKQDALWTISSPSFAIRKAHTGFNLTLPGNFEWYAQKIAVAFHEFKQKSTANQWPWGKKAHLPADV